jgi:hypothetical protein
VTNSYESRYWGAVSRDAVTLRSLTMIYWSVSRDQSGSEKGQMETNLQRRALSEAPLYSELERPAESLF